MIDEVLMKQCGLGQRNVESHETDKFGAKFYAVILVGTKKVRQFVE